MSYARVKVKLQGLDPRGRAKMSSADLNRLHNELTMLGSIP